MGTIREDFNAFAGELQKLYEPEEANAVARLFFHEKLGITRLDMAIKKEQELKLADKKYLSEAMVRLLKGEPVQHIIGRVHFSGCVFRVNKNVLIPRPETEELVHLISKENKNHRGLHILDIGTGSGCIAISLAKQLPDSNVKAIDNSQKALEVAQLNAIANQATIDFLNSDILNAEAWKKLGSFDVIVSNPPYIPEKEKNTMHQNVLEHEPHSALFVPDNDPLLFYKKIAALAAKKLVKGGLLYFEVNESMGLEVKKLLEELSFTDTGVIKDLRGKDRFVKARKEG